MNRLEEKIKIFKYHNIKNDILLSDLIRFELNKYLYQFANNTVKLSIEENYKYIIDLFTETKVDVNFEIEGSVFKIDIPDPSILDIKISYFDIINKDRIKKLKNISK